MQEPDKHELPNTHKHREREIHACFSSLHLLNIIFIFFIKCNGHDHASVGFSFFFFIKYFPNKYNINSITVINDDIQEWPNAISVLSKIKFKPKWISWWTRIIFSSILFWSNFNYSGASMGRSNVYKMFDTFIICVQPKIISVRLVSLIQIFTIISHKIISIFFMFECMQYNVHISVSEKTKMNVFEKVL